MRDSTCAITHSGTVEHSFLEKKCLGPERLLIRRESSYWFSFEETTRVLRKCTWMLTRQSRCSEGESTWYAQARVPKICGGNSLVSRGTTPTCYCWTMLGKNNS